MKMCYCDESGTGNEPIAVMVGILVDTQRMHITKDDWRDLLEELSAMSKREVTELHTRDFYAGNGIWRNLDGELRSALIAVIFDWLKERRHKVVFTSVNKRTYRENYRRQFIPEELNTVWRFMGFHLVLAIQKYCQKFNKSKGHTIFIFDNEDREQLRFTDVIVRPPDWSSEYYSRGSKEHPLNQIVDVPYFGDSKEVGLIQVADFAAFFLRRYAEIKEELISPKYHDEEEKIEGWIEQLKSRSIGTNFTYMKVGRSKAAEIFYANASEAIRSL